MRPADVIKDAIVQVGEGRGFLINREPWPPDILTAAHCLPFLPPAHPASYTSERTYRDFIGPRGGPTTLWAECVFVDPIADVAILCCPDGQSYYEQAEAYEAFTESRATLTLGSLTAECEAWLLTLDDQWERCRVRPGIRGVNITLIDAVHGSAPGTSGSPILIAGGADNLGCHAVGLVSVGLETVTGDRRTLEREQGGQPALLRALPAGWLEDPHALKTAENKLG